jgi:hypothetical protein
MNKYYVYLHKLKNTNTVFYVGKGSGLRAFNLHLRSKYHKRIVKKYGCDVELAQEQAFLLEQKLIKYYKSIKQARANLTLGGEGCLGRKVSVATRAQIAKKLLGTSCSVETKNKMRLSKLGKSSGMLGKRHKVESNLKRSISLKNSPKLNRKSIKCITNGKIYASLSEACLKLNLSGTSNLAKVLKGLRTHISGLRFEYVE